jgi:Tfp pilus assembly protein PilF
VEKLNSNCKTGSNNLLAAICLLLVVCSSKSLGQAAAPAPAPAAIQILEIQGLVEILPVGETVWVSANTNRILHSFDRIHTAANSRIALRWSDQSVLLFSASTELEILPPDSSGNLSGLHLIRGMISFFHRDKPGRIRIITGGAVAGVEGTEFVLAVNDADRTTLSVIDGKVNFGNEQGRLSLTNNQQASVEPGQAPVRSAGFIANNLLQWCFYYPAVVDPDELPLTTDEQRNLADSLAAYRNGDLLAALAKFPAGTPGSDAGKMYHAALLLSVGEVEQTGALLASLPKNSGRTGRLADALRELIAAVKRQSVVTASGPQLASEFLAGSYYEQSVGTNGPSLKSALHFARQAAAISPKFGFAWERVAELEFSFGHTAQAQAALDKSLALAPRNAQALALQGFLLAAQNQTRAAIVWFDRALAADPALGNAWLGRGLCRIRRGDAAGGREDLLVAAALEPQRAELRNYLGKAYANAGDVAHAGKELQLAKKLDPNDPTAWLYSALLKQEGNQVNDAIRDLEKSKELNDNRSVYRSQFLLDQDQAVRSANLALIYKDAGMTDVSLREAGRAVNYDYANYSAHLFLANSYSGLSDPNYINLRYETPAENEYLLANLLAPVSAGPLSPVISQGEYSSLFTHDGFGVVSSTEYLSRGAWTQSGAQFGVYGDSSYDFEAFYHSDPGQRVNDDIEQRQLSLTLKHQVTPQDGVYFNIQQYQADFGDVAQYYDSSMANPDARLKESQDPNLSIGYNHEWSPGVHTLFLAARLNDAFSFTNPVAPTLVAFAPEFTPGVPTLTSVQGISSQERYLDLLTIYSGELQQIWETAEHTTIVGGRIQYGDLDTTTRQDMPSTLAAIFPDPPTPMAQQNLSSQLQRFSGYGYHQWQIFEPLRLIGGLAYDHLSYPENFRTAPISGKEQTSDQFSPKAGFIWTPLENTVARFAYTRSLSGATVDQSYQLEPSQVAGFLQNYRSVIPESIVGATAGADIDAYNLSLEQKFRTGTYLAVAGQILDSTVNRVDGTFAYNPLSLTQPYPVPSGLRENLDYSEKSLMFTANQLLGREWSLGANYRLSEAKLNDRYGGVPTGLFFNNFQPRQQTQGTLGQLDLTANFNHPCGIFAEGEALWYDQSNSGYTPAEPGDNFWQFNLFVGWRSPHRRMELTFGLLNLAGQDYNLNPLNVYTELPRERTLLVRFKFNF